MLSLPRPKSLARVLILGFAVVAINPIQPLSAEDSAPSERTKRARQIAEERLAYAKSPVYNPYDTKSVDQAKIIRDLLDKKDFPAAIAAAIAGLSDSPYDLELAMLLTSAYRESGDTMKAAVARERWFTLVDSIVESGDGRSYESAFKVISVHEEYAVIRALQLQPMGQSLRSHGESKFDVIKVKSRDSGQEFELYFNVDLPQNWLAQEINGAQKGPSKTR